MLHIYILDMHPLHPFTLHSSLLGRVCLSVCVCVCLCVSVCLCPLYDTGVCRSVIDDNTTDQHTGSTARWVGGLPPPPSPAGQPLAKGGGYTPLPPLSHT